MSATFLQQALELAKIRRGFCAPNPAVGAVLVQNNQVIATGYHFASGSPHAEVDALNKITMDLSDLTLYVTLEPCCHTNKKTPPCTELIIQRGIKKVIYGYRDPNPEVAGRGEKILKAAGVICEYQSLPEINQFYLSYDHWWRTKTPIVTAKLALSLDGKIAGVNSRRVTLTGPLAQQFTHQQRKLNDAILTTAKTIYFDDPLLNIRLDSTAETYAKPIYILDRQLTVSLTAHIFKTATQVILLHDSQIDSKKIKYYETHGARCVAVTSYNQQLDLQEVLKIIGQDGIHDLWVEAGGHCFAAFAQANLLHYAYLYVAPQWLGVIAQSAFVEPVEFFKTAREIQWHGLGPDAIAKITW